MFTPVLAKHSPHLNLVDILPVAVDLHRNFELMRKQVEAARYFCESVRKVK